MKMEGMQELYIAEAPVRDTGTEPSIKKMVREPRTIAGVFIAN